MMTEETKMDYIIRNGIVVDGTGTPGYRADIGITRGDIVAIGDLRGSIAEKYIDARGNYVTPGFIDMHSHADCSAPMWPEMESALGQGITTCFAGHCGMGIAPVHDYWLEMCFEEPAVNRVMPQYPGGPRAGHGRVVSMELFRPAFEKTFGISLDWGTFGEYLDHLDRGIGANLVCNVGHSQLRQQVLGFDAARYASPDERRRIGALLSASFEEGAYGLGIGLDYYSSMDADREELLYLMRIAKDYGRMVTFHVQSRPSRYGKMNPKFTYGEGLTEVLELGRESGAKIHISHLRSVCDTPGEGEGISLLNRKAAEASLALLEYYRGLGVNVSWDFVCGPVLPVFHYPKLVHGFRPYVDICGGPAAFAEALKNPWYRDSVLNDIRSGQHQGRSSFTSFQPAFAKQQRFLQAEDKGLIGKTLMEAAKERGMDVAALALDIISEDPEVMCGAQVNIMPDAAQVFTAEPYMAFGTDNGAYNYDYAQQDGPQLVSYGSPSAFCQMIEYLNGEYDLSFEQKVQRMTGNAAKLIGLSDRGVIREGMRADLVVLDRSALKSNYNLIKPATRPSGIEWVFVNGQIAVAGDVFTHVQSGRAIRFSAESQKEKKNGI